MEYFVALVAKAIIGGIAKSATDLAIKQVRARWLDPGQRPPPRTSDLVRQETLRVPVGPAGGTYGPRPAAFTGKRPSKILVYPTVWSDAGIGSKAPGLVHDALTEVPGLAEYAVISTALGGFEAASARLGDRPAIVVRFEANEGYLDAFAYLHALFPTTDNARAFEVKVARFGWGPHASRPYQGSFPTWQYVNLAELEYPDDQIVAAVVAWFIVNCVQLYWQFNGDPAVDLLAKFGPGTGTGTEPARPQLTTDAASDRRSRIQSEFAELRRHGFDVQKWESGFAAVQLVATRGDLEIGFMLDRNYPDSAPLVVFEKLGERAHLTIDAASWSADCRLLQIAEGLA
ncbi:hypothetical protein [Streptomyces griseorubiginosus]|uniref:hypothetical protein n=1 Tax=Streptomyces griseorubiginosus TaxID=67304 RepID=UPI001AD7A4A1|nr:hypothetical protein [Streptomyces griseorubiginosus]MBO4258332.1 hypothetical protein [Streptomyces griseorubiginosus]